MEYLPAKRTGLDIIYKEDGEGFTCGVKHLEELMFKSWSLKAGGSSRQKKKTLLIKTDVSISEEECAGNESVHGHTTVSRVSHNSVATPREKKVLISASDQQGPRSDSLGQ